jgi:hypothetical protein
MIVSPHEKQRNAMAEEPPGNDRPTGSRAEGISFSRLSIQLAALALVLALAGMLVGNLVAGSKGLWGALLAAAVIGAFFASSAVVMHLLRTTDAQAKALLVLWFAKLLVLFPVLFALNSATFIDRKVFGVTMLVGIIGSIVLESRVVWSARLPPGQGA